MASPAIQQALETALAHEGAGRLVDAERVYRQILLNEPTYCEALHHLGLIICEAEDTRTPKSSSSAATRYRMVHAGYYSDPGFILTALHEGTDAIEYI